MGHSNPPERGFWGISLAITQPFYFIAEQSIVVEVVGLTIAVRIQGIHDPVAVRIEQPNHYAVVRGHPDTPISIVVAPGDSTSQVMTGLSNLTLCAPSTLSSTQ